LLASNLRELTAVGNDDRLGAGSGLGTNGLNGLDNVQTLGHVAEDAMLAIQPCGFDSAQEELGAVGVWASVSHGQNTRASVLKSEILISELFTVDGLTTGSVAAGEITTLAHEAVDDTMESRALEVERLAGAAHTLLAGAQASEIFSGLGNNISAESHLDAAGWLTTDGHVEENNWVGHGESEENLVYSNQRNFFLYTKLTFST